MRKQVHDAATIFPMMGETALQDLADDIRSHGQRDAIELLDGLLIDGRNREKACELAGVEPHYRELKSGVDPVSHVLSKNLHRRHLSDSQRAMIGARAKAAYAVPAKERQVASLKKGTNSPVKEKLPEREKVQSRDLVAKTVNVSGKTIDFATTVLTKGSPELVAAVDAGEVAVSKAARIARTIEPTRQADAATCRTEKLTPAQKVKRFGPPNPDNYIPAARITGTLKAIEELQERLERCGVLSAAKPCLIAIRELVKQIRGERPSGNTTAPPETSAFDGLNTAIKSLVASANVLHGTRAGKFLNVRLVRSQLKAAGELIAEARPVAICPYCEGRKCSICARTGAVTRDIKSQYTPEGK